MLTFQYNDIEIKLAFVHERLEVELPFLVNNQVKKEVRDTCTVHLFLGEDKYTATAIRNPKEKFDREAAQKYALSKLLNNEYVFIQASNADRVASEEYKLRTAIWKAYHFPFQAPLPKSSGLVVERKICNSYGYCF